MKLSTRMSVVHSRSFQSRTQRCSFTTTGSFLVHSPATTYTVSRLLQYKILDFWQRRLTLEFWRLFAIKAAFCLSKPQKYFLYFTEVFSLHGGCTHEQIFLVQKLAWLALEQDSLARKKCHFSPSRTSRYKRKTVKSILWNLQWTFN
jgi:hypothetical protein